MSARIVFAGFKVPQPVGGLLMIAEHARSLRAAGYDAQFWYPFEGGESALETGVPEIATPQLDLTAEDLLVVPEPAVASGVDPAPGVRKAIFNQNHFLTYTSWDGKAADYPGWSPRPQVWTVSRESRDVLTRLHPWLPVQLIPYQIDPGDFRCLPRERPVISWMPRKRPNEEALIRHLLANHPRAAEVEVREIANQPRAEVGQILATTSVFLSLGHTESFGLPVAEALVAGCLVVGYTGGGGVELFDAPGAWLIPDQRPALLVDRAFELLGTDDTDAAASLRDENRRWIQERYHAGQTRAALLAAVRTSLEGPGAAGPAVHPMTQMPRPEPNFNILG